jgi:integrase
MGRSKNSSTLEIHNGVYLKRSDNHAAWQCYFRLDSRQFRRSTKTTDLAEAKLIALRWYQDAKSKAAVGRSVERVSFRKLVSIYLELISGTGKLAYHRDTLARHISPFFNKFSDVSKIDDGDIQDYVIYRRSKNDVTPQTINRENTVLRQLLKVGERRGWLLQPVHVDHLNERMTKRRRPHFTVPEYVQLCHVAQQRIRELQDSALSKRAYQQRLLLYDLIKFIANSGVRIDETKSICWRHVDFDAKTVLIEHAGKTMSTRTVYVRYTGLLALQRIKDRRLAYLSEMDGRLSGTEPVFATIAGQQIASFKKGFNALLVAAGFIYNEERKKHSLTSLRHSYATFRLPTKRAKRASMRALALQMGTSERMIDQHYGHDQIHDYEDELAG